MAYSEDTQAIIDRLKAEGDLIRNSETNSVKSLNVKLEKFDGLFQSINANVIEQTQMMKAQVGIASDAAERARTQEQFDEVTPSPTANQTDDYDDSSGGQKKDFNNAIDKIGDSLAKTFSLKNILIGAGVGFVGYNFLKGFIDSYGGLRPLLKELGVKDSTFNTLDSIGPSIEKMKTEFDAFVAPEGPLDNFKTNLGNLNTNLASLNTTFESIRNMNWETIAAVALAAFPILGLSIRLAGLAVDAVRYKFKKMTADLDKGMKPDAKGRPWYYKFFGPGADDVDGGTPKNYGPTGPPDDGLRGGQTPNPKPTVKVPKNGGGPPGTIEGFDKSQVRLDAQKAAPNKFKFDSKNRLQNTKGGFTSDADALKYLQKTLDPKYSKIFSGILKGAGILSVVISVYDAYRIYNILNNTDGSYDTDDKKIAGIGPIIGPLFTGFAAGAIGSAFGFMVGGPWGALGGGIVFGLAGAFASPEVFGVMLAKALFGLTPSAEDKKILTGQSVEPRPKGTGIVQVYAQQAWDEKNAGKFDPNTGAQLMKPGTNLGNFGRGTVVEKPGARSEYVTRLKEGQELDALIRAEDEYQKNQEMIIELEDYLKQFRSNSNLRDGSLLLDGQNNNVTILNNNAPHIAPTVVQQGGSELTQISFGGGGGSGKTDSVFQYGLPNSVA
jgi:hypothetical protein